MAKRVWQFNPNAGGQKVPDRLQDPTRHRILQHGAKVVPKHASQLRVRFKGVFCYIDIEEPGSVEPSPLCRMRYMGSPDRWTLAFYTYSHEKYEPCVFMSGDFFGTPEEALEIGSVYLG